MKKLIIKKIINIKLFIGIAAVVAEIAPEWTAPARMDYIAV